MKPIDPEFPSVDFDLLVESEQAYFSREMRLLRTKARELGYGDGPEANLHSVRWFDLGDYDPMINRKVKMDCLNALGDEERGIVETLREILGKVFRLTEVLSEEEKCLIRKFNKVKRILGSNLLMDGTKKGITQQEFAELDFQYDQIMARYGEKTFE